MDNSLIIMSGSIYLISGSVRELDFVESNTGSAHFKSNISLDTTDNSSLSITSNTASFYMSASGAIGIGTMDPTSGFDVISNEVQFQKPGTRKGLRINDEGNIESFNKDAESATTGSEFILTYSRGATVTAVSLAALGIIVADNAAATTYYNALSAPQKNALLAKLEFYGFNQQPNIGDTLGSIRFIAESGSSGYNNRIGGEAASIKAVINDIDATGVQSDLIFSVAQKGGSSSQKLLLDALGQHELTGSLTLDGILYGTIYANEFSSIPGSIFTSANRALSSSFALTSSFVTRLNQSVIITGSLLTSGSANITGPVTIGISNITTNTITASVAGDNLVFNQATGSYTAAKYLYTCTSESNARTGEVIAVWNGTSIQYTDYSTLDIGSTTNVTASVSIVTAQAQFNVQTATSGWKIKSYVTYL